MCGSLLSNLTLHIHRTGWHQCHRHRVTGRLQSGRICFRQCSKTSQLPKQWQLFLLSLSMWKELKIMPFFLMCTCGLHACGGLRVCAPTCGGLRFALGIFLDCFTHILWGRASQSDPELADTVSLPNQPAPRIPLCLSPKAGITGNPSTHLAFKWILGFWTLVVLFV